MKHYSEADLLETYYMQPGQSMPVMMHLAECTDCAARYERLEAKLRQSASCHTSQPDTFWSRQRHTIMRTIRTRRDRSVVATRAWRTAAAAALAFLLGGAVVFETIKPSASNAKTTTVTDAKATNKPPIVEPGPKTPPEDLLLHDAWQSDELRQFHGVVQWESWTPETTPAKGDAPL
jgi:hypothetical protein